MFNMRTYIEINKQLVEQNTVMRKEIAAYRAYHSDLSQQLLDERTLRVIERQKYTDILIRNFRATLTEINPDIDLLNVLSADYGAGADDDRQNASTASRQRTPPSRQASEQRSSLIRYSFVPPLSPTRRKVRSPLAAVSPPIVLESRRSASPHISQPSVNDDEAEQSQEETENCIDLESSSIEEPREALDEQKCVAVSQAENLQERNDGDVVQLDNINEDTEEETRMLSNATYGKENSSSSMENSNHRPRSKRQRTSTVPLRDLTNSQQSSIEESTLEHTATTHGEKIDIKNISLPRFEITPSMVSSAVPHVAGVGTVDDVLHSFTIEDNIAEAPSSTPRNLTAAERFTAQPMRSTRSQLALRVSEATAATNTITPGRTMTTRAASLMSVSDENNSRPRRKCTPQILSEPSLRVKMRNEGTSKKRKIQK